MLGISLLFVGIVLVHNGILFMSKVKRDKVLDDGTTTTELVPLVVASPKSIAFFNAIVGGLLFIGNIIMLAHSRQEIAEGPFSRYMVFNNIAAGFLFGVTYLFLAGNLLFKLDMRPFGIFSGGVVIFSAVMSVYNFINFADVGLTYGYPMLMLGILWIIWGYLWLTGTLQFNFKVKAMEKIFPWSSIIVGVISAFVPAIMLLLGLYPFSFL